MGYILKLDQRRRHEPPEAKQKKTISSRVAPLVRNLSNPRIIVPSLDWKLLRHVAISKEAEAVLERVQELDGDSAYPPVRLCLAELNKGETASTAEGVQFLKRWDTFYATVPEFIGFLRASVFRTAFADRTIVALGTHLRDEFDQREALAFEHHSKSDTGTLFTVFAERIRRDWLLLIVAQGRVAKP